MAKYSGSGDGRDTNNAFVLAFISLNQLAHHIFIKVNECSNDLTYSMVTRKRLLLSSVESAPSFYIVIHSSQTGDTVLKNTYLPSRELFFLLTIRYLIIMGSYVRFPVMFCTFAMSI